jgi:putative DNA-invertase from lambdoid prophage Rac
MRAALYARVSTHDQQTLGMQIEAMATYLSDRGWGAAKRVEDVGSGTKDRPGRESLLKAARRREVDVIVVWRLDRWGRSLPDLVVTLRELTDLGVGFVSLTEALDLTTPAGRAMAGMLAVFAEFEREILRERVRAGIAQARKDGRPPRPPADRVAPGRPGAPARGRAGEPLGDRPTAGDRPDLGATHLGRRLRAILPCARPPAASRVRFTGRLQREGV